MVVAQECDSNFRSNNYENKSFPRLYKDTIENYYPNVPKYNDIEDLHIQRNRYQHKVWSITHHFNRQYALNYIYKTKEIMISVGILDLNDVIQPTNYLKKINNSQELTFKKVSKN